jgi:hypothetical protein
MLPHFNGARGVPGERKKAAMLAQNRGQKYAKLLYLNSV